MYVLRLRLEEGIRDFFRIVEQVNLKILESVIYLLLGFFSFARYVVYKIICGIMIFTSIGFMIGIGFLVKGISDCISLGIGITQLDYFYTIVLLCGVHLFLTLLAVLIKPKY